MNVEEKLKEIDDTLASYEDWMKGEDGDNCTRARNLLQELGLEKTLYVNVNNYDYQCSDGCCDWYGLEISINGEKLSAENDDLTFQLKQVLEHLGYKVNLTELYNGEEL